MIYLVYDQARVSRVASVLVAQILALCTTQTPHNMQKRLM